MHAFSNTILEPMSEEEHQEWLDQVTDLATTMLKDHYDTPDLN